jgi:hypothetical protein
VKGSGRYSVDLTRRQIEYVTQALLADIPEREIMRQGNAPPHSLCINHARLRKLKERIFAEWDRNSVERRAHAREMQIVRISRRMRMLDRALVDKPLDTKLHRAIAKYESQLMEIQGTKEPIKIDVDWFVEGDWMKGDFFAHQLTNRAPGVEKPEE